MKYIISEPRLSMFLRRRFSAEDLLWIVNDVKKMIDQGYNVDTALYGAIREFVRSGFADIDEFGYEQSYWDSYLKYEDALIPYVKFQLGLD